MTMKRYGSKELPVSTRKTSIDTCINHNHSNSILLPKDKMQGGLYRHKQFDDFFNLRERMKLLCA